MHSQMIRKLYHCMLHEENAAEKFSHETEEAVKEILEGLDFKNREKIRDGFYLAASAAEENGFVKGFTAASRLFPQHFME